MKRWQLMFFKHNYQALSNVPKKVSLSRTHVASLLCLIDLDQSLTFLDAVKKTGCMTLDLLNSEQKNI